MGSLILNLWDCGGQDKFMEEYFSTQKETIFLNASVMIYVFGANDEGTRNEKSLHYW